MKSEFIPLFQENSHSSYSIRAKEISAMLRDRPITPKEELINSIEYAAKHPRLADVLSLESAGMPLWEYYCVDVIGAILIVVSAVIALLFMVLKRIVRVLIRVGRIKAKKA
jgi:hypothetical protein